jgi:hypothetical protein
MSAKGFRSVFMVASCAGAALGCYLVSLRVASERAALESVETKIVLAQRDIRLLQTEIGTRGRLAQLERWNVKVLALSAPSADQFLDGGFALAKLVAPQDKVDLEAPVVLAAAPADGPKPRIEGSEPARPDADEGGAPRQMLHVASLNRDTIRPEAIAEPEKAVAAPKPATAAVKSVIGKTTDKPTNSAAVPKSPAAKSKPTTVAKAPAAKTKAASVERKTTASDPLAPLESAKPSKLAATTSKDNGSKQ